MLDIPRFYNPQKGYGAMKAAQKNFCEMMLCPENETPLQEATELLGRLDANGRFPDVDYTDQHPNNWHPRIHFERMVRLLSNRQVLEDNNLRGRAMRGMDFWLKADLHNPNWWHNQIGQPRYMGMAALLLKSWLTEEQRMQALRILEQGSLYSNPGFHAWTGANLLWGVSNTLQHALLAGDFSIAEKALGRAEQELVIKDGDQEGIKPDYSFFQHSTQLYTGGYGRSFVEEVSRIIFVLHGTSMQFSTAHLQVLADYILEGQRWAVKDDGWDFTTVGREIARPEALSGPALRQSLYRLSLVEEMPRRTELSDFYRQVAGKGCAKTPEGDRFFPYGRLYVSRHDGRYISTRLTDPGQMMGETINGENFYSANLYTGGVTCLMVDGREYSDLAPVWHPCFIPGSTARVEGDDALLKKRSLWHGRCAENTYAFGTAFDKNSGCVWQDMCYNGITGTIARFFFNGIMVALGSGLTASGSEAVVTSLDQCRLRHAPEKVSLPGIDTVCHNGFVYASLDGKGLQMSEETRTGDWRRINESEKRPPEIAAVLTLWIEHGAAPKNASYAYAVAMDRESAPYRLAGLKIISNTTSWQAVQSEDQMICVFHQDGIYTLPDGRKWRGERGKAIRIAVS